MRTWATKEDLVGLAELTGTEHLAILMDAHNTSDRRYLAIPFQNRTSYPLLKYVGEIKPGDTTPRFTGYQLQLWTQGETMLSAKRKKNKPTSMSLAPQDLALGKFLMEKLGCDGFTTLFRRLANDRYNLITKTYFPGRIRLMGIPAVVIAFMVDEVAFYVGEVNKEDGSFVIDEHLVEKAGLSAEAVPLLRHDVELMLEKVSAR